MTMDPDGATGPKLYVTADGAPPCDCDADAETVPLIDRLDVARCTRCGTYATGDPAPDITEFVRSMDSVEVVWVLPEDGARAV